MHGRRRFLAAAAALALPAAARADDAIFERLRRGGLVLLMRHASTGAEPGDPPGLRLGDCSTQRNLSSRGRQEARHAGERLRAERVPVAHVYTSPWCRCRDTAMLAFGAADEWEPLGSFLDSPEREADYTERVRKRIASYLRRNPQGNVAMVTHAMNIMALTRKSVDPGEIVVVRPDGCCGARPVERLRLS